MKKSTELLETTHSEQGLSIQSPSYLESLRLVVNSFASVISPSRKTATIDKYWSDIDEDDDEWNFPKENDHKNEQNGNSLSDKPISEDLLKTLNCALVEDLNTQNIMVMDDGAGENSTKQFRIEEETELTKAENDQRAVTLTKKEFSCPAVPVSSSSETNYSSDTMSYSNTIPWAPNTITTSTSRSDALQFSLKSIRKSLISCVLTTMTLDKDNYEELFIIIMDRMLSPLQYIFPEAIVEIIKCWTLLNSLTLYFIVRYQLKVFLWCIGFNYSCKV
jgi:hypothetical protein